ncbi:MAG: PTS sugar transporter subunit IIA [Desulfovibrio sp.]|uniref:PTS sugar transporter subunit IIA n=1 Tax=Desulfovibrio sp. 7SRBS1 TaxID=3378064 RepID=UPI003B3C96D7
MSANANQLTVGLLVVTHKDYGQALLEAAELIMGDAPDVKTVGVEASTEVDAIITRIQEAVREADKGHGVLVLTDMFGGTPTNLSLSLLNKQNLEVVTGVNMPMLLKAMGGLHLPLGQLAAAAKQAGEGGIIVAGELLRKKAGV